MPIPMNELLEAYKAIHVIRRFADDHASELSFIVTMASGDCVNPVAMVHDAIQNATYAQWSRSGCKPFVHDGQIVYWDHKERRMAFTDLIHSHELAD